MVASPAADLWSLGLLAYEMMAGQPLFGAQYSNSDVTAMLLGYVFDLTHVCTIAWTVTFNMHRGHHDLRLHEPLHCLAGDFVVMLCCPVGIQDSEV